MGMASHSFDSDQPIVHVVAKLPIAENKWRRDIATLLARNGRVDDWNEKLSDVWSFGGNLAFAEDG